jgi:hypothetical protein
MLNRKKQRQLPTCADLLSLHFPANRESYPKKGVFGQALLIKYRKRAGSILT